jgi:hypothetical protein
MMRYSAELTLMLFSEDRFLNNSGSQIRCYGTPISALLNSGHSSCPPLVGFVPKSGSRIDIRAS